MLNEQIADCTNLAELVERITYKPGWRIWLEQSKTRPTEHLAGSSGTTLCIGAEVFDSTSPGITNVEHWFAPPPASWDTATWERWVLECIIQVETHEAMEFYRVDGHASFFPAHGPGKNPYEIRKV